MLYRICTERRDNLAALASAHFKEFTLIPVQGYWERVAEDVMIIEIAENGADIRDRVFALAAEIKRVKRTGGSARPADELGDSAGLNSLFEAKSLGRRWQ